MRRRPRRREAFHAAFVDTLRRGVAGAAGGAPLLEAWRRAGYGLGKLERILFDCHRKLACIYPPRDESLRPAARFDPALLERAVAALAGAGRERRAAAGGAQEAQQIHSSTGRGAHAAPGVPFARRCGKRAPDRRRCWRRWSGWIAASRRTGQQRPRTDLFRSILRLCRAEGAGRSPWSPHPGTRPWRSTRAFPPLAALLANELLPLVRARLERRKREAGLFDFQDMLTLVARSLDGDGARARGLIATLRARYRYALVDEFQDTDEVQWQIFRQLFFDDGGAQRLTLVGDPKQAIYGFRGADVHAYLRARQRDRGRAGTGLPERQLPLDGAAHRGVGAMLDERDAAPFFRKAGPDPLRPPGLVRPARSWRWSTPPATPAAPVVVLDVAEGRRVAGDQAALLGDQAGAAAIEWRARSALLLGRGDADGRGRLFIRARRPDAAAPDAATRAVRCVPATSSCSRAPPARAARSERRCARARIPFAYFKQEKLFDTVEAEAVLDLLRALADPEDRSARFARLITGFFGLTLARSRRLRRTPGRPPAGARLRIGARSARPDRCDRLFARIVDDSGIDLAASCSRRRSRGASERTMTNYLHLFELLQERGRAQPCTLRELVQRLGGYVSRPRRPPGLDADIQRLETDADAVQIMTIHHSKGLEAAMVFIYGATWPCPWWRDARFPRRRGAAHRARRPPARGGRDALQGRAIRRGEARLLRRADPRARAALPAPLPGAPTGAQVRRRLPASSTIACTASLGGITPAETRASSRSIPVSRPPPPRRLRQRRVWRPPLAAWHAPADAGERADVPHAAFHQAATARGGFMVTSYSAMSGPHQRFVAGRDARPAADEVEVPADGAGSTSIARPRR